MGFTSRTTLIGCPFTVGGRSQLANMMRTLALLAPRHRTLRAVVHGPSAAHDEMRMHASALGVAPLLSFLDDGIHDPIGLTKACDFVWIAADHDAAALGCLDAMALSKPVVSERSPLAEHYVADGINGVLLPGDDPSQLAASVADLIARPETQIAFGNTGRARVQREFSEQVMIDGFERAAMSAADAGRVTR
jgi:glycosyltransferase involved in cell wall biosynthesis